jgi:hypothetical protein
MTPGPAAAPASAVPVVRVRPGVKFDRIAPAGFVLLAHFHSATRVLGVDLVISCGTEGHADEDPHSSGEAYDLSVAVWTVDVILRVRAFLQNALGPLFTVLYETPFVPSEPRLAAIATVNPAATAPHLHAQRRKGTIYPPAAGRSLNA